LGRAEAVPALTAAFVNDTAVYVRCDAVLALGRLGLEESAWVLLDRFHVENFEVRKRIVIATRLFNHQLSEQMLAAIDGMLGSISATDGERRFLRTL
jgi:hypothetical protein